MKNKIKKYGRDFLGLSFIALVVILFFFKLFWPTPQLIVTPDFGRSDAWHFSFATKYFLSENLKQGKLPLWSSKLDGGFPILAEGQIGAFYLPNLIFYRILDAVTAYNLTLVLALVVLGWGTYIFLRMISLSQTVSLASGVTMAFSATAITQLTHITLLQGMSLLPAVGCATLLLAQKKSFLSIALLAVLLSQQFLAGFPQASFITLLFSGGFYFYLTYRRQTRLIDIGRYLAALILTAGLSAIQFLPSWEFLKYSLLPGGFLPNQSTAYSFPFKHLLSFLNPFYFGNPKFGTYPPFTIFHGSIFWENTGFIGILPLVSLLAYLIIRKKNLRHGFFLASLGSSMLFMLGAHGPLYFIYSLWPFSLFRVPSRFIWIFVFSLLTLASFGLENIYLKVKKMGRLPRYLLLILLGINFVFTIGPWQDYHDFEPAGVWLDPPVTKKWLNPGDRVYDLGSEVSYNRFFLKSGWTNPQPNFFLRNLLAPDTNLLWQVSAARVYAGRSLQRQGILNDLINTQLSFTENEASMSSLGLKILSLSSVNKVITALPFKDKDSALQLKNILAAKGDTIWGYENSKSTPEAYFAREIVTATTAEESVRMLSQESFIPGSTVLLEKPVATHKFIGNPKITLSRPGDSETLIKVSELKTKSVLVLNDTYYPGWKATIDGKITEILPANINFRAVLVPPGSHLIKFKYQPQSLVSGATLSGLTLIFIISVEAFLRCYAVFHTRQKASELAKRLSRSRGK